MFWITQTYLERLLQANPGAQPARKNLGFIPESEAVQYFITVPKATHQISTVCADLRSRFCPPVAWFIVSRMVHMVAALIMQAISSQEEINLYFSAETAEMTT